MTREEFSKLVKGMKSVYADPKFIADQDAFNMWYALLNDLEYSVASVAVQTYMMSNKFYPMPSDIREYASKQSTSGELNSNEAWAMVYKALCNSNYHAEEEFAKLPELVQKAVGSADNLRSLAGSSDFNEEVEKSLFTKTYEAVRKRAKEDAKLPEQLRTMIASTPNLMLESNENP